MEIVISGLAGQLSGYALQNQTIVSAYFVKLAVTTFWFWRPEQIHILSKQPGHHDISSFGGRIYALQCKAKRL